MNILVQPGYRSNITLKKILSGISDSASEQLKCYISEEEIDNDEKIAVILGVDKEWEKNICIRLANKQIHPIVVFPSGDVSALPYSFITTDDFYTFSDLVTILEPYSKKGIVLAGFNPSSSTDITKLKGFRHGLSLCKKDFKDEYVYESNDNISECIQNLISDKDKFDTIICVNDISALLTCSMLPDIQNYNITGFNGMLCTKYCNPKITTIGIDYYSLGCAVVEAYNSLRKNSFMLKQSFYIKSKLICGETTPCLKDDSLYSIKPQDVSSYSKPLKVYDDSTVKELDSIETLLQQSDETDLKILKLLAMGKKYEEISAETFLSITPLKYRINKMLKNSGFGKKTELTDILEKYGIFQNSDI